MKRLASFVAYQTCWFACVLGAGSPWATVGIVGTAVFVVVHLMTTPASLRRREVNVVVASTLIGAVGDSALVLTGVTSFDAAVRLGPLPSPLWFIALWAGFGATATSTLRGVLVSPWRAAAFGGVAGPLAYAAGTHVVPMHLGAPIIGSLVAIGALWTMAMLVIWRVADVNGDKKG